MRSKKTSIGKWLALLGAFVVAMFCLFLGFTVLIGNNTGELSISQPTSTIVQQTEIIPATIPATRTQSPTNTTSPSPTAVVPATEIPPIILEPTAQPVSGTLRFHFVNVGQGDATVIQTPGGQTMLIDGGDPNTGIVQYLQSLGIQRIDLMVATHPHSDHIGGLVQVLQSIPVTKVIYSGEPYTTSTFEHFIDAIGTARAEYVEVKRGDSFSLEGISFHVLNPTGTAFSDNPNENSVVLQFTYGTTTFLLMGDGGAEAEAAMLSVGIPLKATILKVGHHGSTSGSTPAFLNTVKPEIALYSAGINNSYHHPSSKTITALSFTGTTIYGTDKNGTIDIDVSANGYTINMGGSPVQGSNTVTIPNIPVEPPMILATQAPSGNGDLTIVSVTSPVSKGSNATVVASTSPGTACTITVYYKSGPSSASGLEPQTADASGQVSWTWKVSARTTSGNWRIVVNCGSATQETYIQVQ